MTTAQRIIVVGTTGSGKTTLARRLATRLALPHVELDALHWEPSWTEAPLDVLRARVADAVSGDRWVCEGNYAKLRDQLWPRAQMIVWLDYPLPLVLWRLLWRTIRRTLSSEELWNGNRERFREQFLSRQSLFLWALQTHPRHRRDYPLAFRQAAHAHLQVVRLRSPVQTEAWLAGMPRTEEPSP